MVSFHLHTYGKLKYQRLEIRVINFGLKGYKLLIIFIFATVDLQWMSVDR